MAFVDPAAVYIEEQKESLTDFIFRMTGDRSRASVTATEISEFVHRELMSAWSKQEIRVELFARAYAVNREAARGIERAFLESYFRHEIKASDVSLHYPAEIFLVEIGSDRALPALLRHRFQFSPEECARILERSREALDIDEQELQKALKAHKKVNSGMLATLPRYRFLAVPDFHPTAISHILVSMKSKRFTWGIRIFLTFILLGLLAGWVIYLLND